jgi:hypothetical protein
MTSKDMVFVTNSINIGYLGEHLLRGTQAHTDMRQLQDLLLDRTVLLTGVADGYRTTQPGGGGGSREACLWQLRTIEPSTYL